MRVCPRCGRTYPDDAAYCTADASALAEQDGVFDGTSAQPIGAGTQLGAYRIEAVLGKGGMGTVFRAHHTRLKRDVAIKVIHPELADDALQLQRFFAEARAANAVGHENLVTVFDFVDAGEHRYYVMELLKGCTLKKLLKDSGKLPLENALAIGRQMADAMAAVHAVGIIHRDLKPDNVFLVKRGENQNFVKVIDFGIAKLTDADALKTSAGTMVGTPAYMSPEQSQGHEVDARTDVYALGAILFEAISGVRPFTGDNISELLWRKAYEPAPRLSTLVDDVPASVEDLVGLALASEAQHRMPSMRVFLDEIDAALSDIRSGATVIANRQDFEDPTAIGGITSMHISIASADAAGAATAAAPASALPPLSPGSTLASVGESTTVTGSQPTSLDGMPRSMPDEHGRPRPTPPTPPPPSVADGSPLDVPTLPPGNAPVFPPDAKPTTPSRPKATNPALARLGAGVDGAADAFPTKEITSSRSSPASSPSSPALGPDELAQIAAIDIPMEPSDPAPLSSLSSPPSTLLSSLASRKPVMLAAAAVVAVAAVVVVVIAHGSSSSPGDEVLPPPAAVHLVDHSTPDDPSAPPTPPATTTTAPQSTTTTPSTAPSTATTTSTAADSPPKPAPAPGPFVRSLPAGASVDVDGKARGKTPLTLKSDDVGKRVSIRMSGYEQLTQTVGDTGVDVVLVKAAPPPPPPPQKHKRAHSSSSSSKDKTKPPADLVDPYAH